MALPPAPSLALARPRSRLLLVVATVMVAVLVAACYPAERRTVVSTAYCLQGQMANGEMVREGSAAMNGVPFGSKWRVVNGPLGGRIYTIRDRIGLDPTDIDFWMAECDAALRYGRRTIVIERVLA